MRSPKEFAPPKNIRTRAAIGVLSLKASSQPADQLVVALEAGTANGSAFETVPAGKRAVIKHVSVYATGDGPEKADYFITSTIEDDSTFREVPIVTKVGALGVIGSHSCRAFAAPGTQFGGVIRRLDTTGRIVATIVIAGYYIPVP
jgi:hypothetical protein